MSDTVKPNANNVSNGKPQIKGSIYCAPLGTALPKNAVDALNEAFANLGYVSDAGVSNARSISSNDTKAWGGDTVNTSQTDSTDAFKYKLIESLNPAVLKAVYGDANVSGDLDNGLAVSVNGSEREACSWIIDMILKGSTLKRIVIPNGKLSELEEIPYNDTDPIGYGLTIKALPDADGNTHYEYLKKASTAQASEQSAG